MARGGRRRRSRGSRPAGDKQPQKQPGQRLKRRGNRPRRPQESALAAMAAPKPKTLQTLPPDGTILEELIDGMKEEYGTPATPQEYRLQIRILAEEEVPEKSPEAAQTNGESGAKVRRSRRRGRRRGRGRPERAAPGAEGSNESGNQ